jgi:hypothetical protein
MNRSFLSRLVLLSGSLLFLGFVSANARADVPEAGGDGCTKCVSSTSEYCVVDNDWRCIRYPLCSETLCCVVDCHPN